MNDKKDDVFRRAESFIGDFMKKSRDYRDNYEYEWERCFTEYTNTRSVQKNILQRANLKLPYGFTVVETFTPQIVEAFTSDGEFLQAKGRLPKDKEIAPAVTNQFNYQLDTDKFLSKFTVLTKNTLIYGTAIQKCIWAVNKKIDYEGEEFTDFEGPTLLNIKLTDFFPDWGAVTPGDIQSMSGCVHRVYRRWDEIKSKERKKIGDETVGIYSNLDLLERSLKIYGEDSAWINLQGPSNEDDRKLNYGANPDVRKFGKIELWEYWGLFDIKGDGVLKECVCTMANGNVVIRVDENPFASKHKPFLAAIDQPLEGEFYGIGEITPIKSLIKEGTALRNARLDQTNQAVNGMWLVNKNAGINTRTLVNRSSGIVTTDDMEGIKALQAPDANQGSFKDVTQIDYDIQNAVSLTNSSQAVSNVGKAFGKTATGVNFMAGRTSSRLGLKVKLIEELFFQNLGCMLLSMNISYLSDEDWAKINGDAPNPFNELDARKAFRQFDFYAASAMNRLNRQERQANLQQNIIPFIQASAQMDPDLYKWDGLAAMFFREFDFDNTKEFLNSPEEKQQIQQQKQQSQMQMQQAQIAAQSQISQADEEVKGKYKLAAEELRGKNKVAAQTTNSVITGAIDGISKLAGIRP